MRKAVLAHEVLRAVNCPVFRHFLGIFAGGNWEKMAVLRALQALLRAETCNYAGDSTPQKNGAINCPAFAGRMVAHSPKFTKSRFIRYSFV